MLSYSFSTECPAALRHSFLLQAKEAFTIALLTKTDGEVVTSKQELHTFLKAAYSLTVVHKWLCTTPQEVLEQATQACQKALAHFYDYDADIQDKDSLCAKIMGLVSKVKQLLGVEPFYNSDEGSFIPDSYRNIKESSVNFTLEGFSRLMQRLQKYHASLCQTADAKCKRSGDQIGAARLCITALGTTVGTLNTECRTEACTLAKHTDNVKEATQRGLHSSAVREPQRFDLCTTLESTDNLGSSWQNLSLSNSGSPSSSGYTGSTAIKQEGKLSDQSCLTTESDVDRLDSMPESDHQNNEQGLKSNKSAVSSHKVIRSVIRTPSSSNGSSVSERFEVIQAGIETLGTEEDWVSVAAGMQQKPPGAEEAAQSLSQLTLNMSSSPLSDSFGSQSSWEKVSADPNAPTTRNPQPNCQSKAETGQSGKSSESEGGYFLLETLDSECPDSAHDLMQQNHTSQQENRELSSQRPLEGFKVDQVSVKPASKISLLRPKSNPGACISTETSTESSFEVLVENQNGHRSSDDSSTEKASVPTVKNPLCYKCNDRTFAEVAPERQYWLSQQDYKALLAGVCNDCLLKRLHSSKSQFKLKKHRTAHSKFWI